MGRRLAAAEEGIGARLFDRTPDGLVATALVTVDVNAAPGAPLVAVEPQVPTTSDVLDAYVVTDAVDPEGEPVTYRVQWRIDGVAASTSWELAGRSGWNAGTSSCRTITSRGRRRSSSTYRVKAR